MILHSPGDLTAPPPSTQPEPARPVHAPNGALRFDVGRLSDNELILFDRAARESWIVYPPRSAYEHLRRPARDVVLVEHHPWAPFSVIALHPVRIEAGCEEHGLACTATAAIQAGADLGWNPFT